MNRHLVSGEVAKSIKCFVTILTFVELIMIVIVNFPNVSLEPVGLRKYFATVTAFICRALCFCIHFRVCSRCWRHKPSVCCSLTGLNVGVSLSVLLVSTVQVVTVTSSQALTLWLWLWTGISLCPIGVLTVNPANDKS